MGCCIIKCFNPEYRACPPLIMPYGKLRMAYVTITFVPYAISCIFFKGMSYGTNIGGLILSKKSL